MYEKNAKRKHNEKQLISRKESPISPDQNRGSPWATYITIEMIIVNDDGTVDW